MADVALVFEHPKLIWEACKMNTLQSSSEKECNRDCKLHIYSSNLNTSLLDFEDVSEHLTIFTMYNGFKDVEG